MILEVLYVSIEVVLVLDVHFFFVACFVNLSPEKGTTSSNLAVRIDLLFGSAILHELPEEHDEL